MPDPVPYRFMVRRAVHRPMDDEVRVKPLRARRHRQDAAGGRVGVRWTTSFWIRSWRGWSVSARTAEVSSARGGVLPLPQRGCIHYAELGIRYIMPSPGLCRVDPPDVRQPLQERGFADQRLGIIRVPRGSTSTVAGSDAVAGRRRRGNARAWPFVIPSSAPGRPNPLPGPPPSHDRRPWPGRGGRSALRARLGSRPCRALVAEGSGPSRRQPAPAPSPPARFRIMARRWTGERVGVRGKHPAGVPDSA